MWIAYLILSLVLLAIVVYMLPRLYVKMFMSSKKDNNTANTEASSSYEEAQQILAIAKEKLQKAAEISEEEVNKLKEMAKSADESGKKAQGLLNKLNK